MPGRGGINRGRGDAELTWGEESDLANTKFKELVLPPGFKEDPKDEVVAVTKSAPDVDPAANVAHGVRRLFDPSAGKETWNRKLRPRRRRVVRNYFDSKQTGSD